MAPQAQKFPDCISMQKTGSAPDNDGGQYPSSQVRPNAPHGA